MKKIGIVVAMQEELLNFLEESGIENLKKEKVFNFDVVTFSMNGKEVYCVKSGVGEIYASAATQLLISYFQVETIMNFGVVGALVPTLKLGEVVLIEKIIHYDFDTSEMDGVPVGYYVQYGTNYFETDKGLREKIQSYSETPLKEVVCASGDKFVGANEKKTYLAETYGAQICEMESAAVMLTSKNAGIPALFVKAVSDGTGGAEEFSKMVATSSRMYVDIIMKFLKD